jgi:hypothetical protein
MILTTLPLQSDVALRVVTHFYSTETEDRKHLRE